MLNLKKSKSDISFEIDVVILHSTLNRINNVTNFGQVAGGVKHHLFVASGGKLFVVGLAQDVMAYVEVEADVKSDGTCAFSAELLLGLLKKRKGSVSVYAKGNDLNYKVGKYAGSIKTTEVTDEIIDEVNNIDATKSAVALKQETLTELKRAVKVTTTKGIVFAEDLPIHIHCEGGKLKATTHDDFHALIFHSKAELKNKDFKLSVFGTAYKVIDSFIANEVVTFSADSRLRVNKKDSLFASIPSIQSSDEDYEIFENVDKLLLSKCVSKFTVSGSIHETVSNMFSLKKASLESSSKFDFSVDKKLTIVYKTTAGQTSESLDITLIEGKKCSFSIGEKLITGVLEPFSNCEAITFYVFDGRFLIEADYETHVMLGVGRFDEN